MKRAAHRFCCYPRCECFEQCIIERAAREEREACATIAETATGDFERDTPARTERETRSGIAAAIRAQTITNK